MKARSRSLTSVGDVVDVNGGDDFEVDAGPAEGKVHTPDAAEQLQHAERRHDQGMSAAECLPEDC